MKDYALKNYTAGTETYRKSFWDYARGNVQGEANLKEGLLNETTGYVFPGLTESKCDSAIVKKSVMRGICSVHTLFGGIGTILAAQSDDIVTFVAENGTIPVKDVADDFSKITLGSYKLASILRLSNEFVRDASFNLESYLAKRIGRAFAGAEDKAFITGTGIGEPTGILHATAGAETGVTADTLTFDDIADLYFSLDKQYRANAVWLMNDTTAQALRKLKDEAGNYLWNHSNDTILGKKVMISEYMPDPDAGESPIVFGDFSYYWIVRRSPLSLKTLLELYSRNDQIGYVVHEFLDGKLVRPEAVKTLKLNEAEEVSEGPEDEPAGEPEPEPEDPEE